MKEDNAILTVGDTITWNGRKGNEPTKEDEVITIVLTPEGGGSKPLGTPIESIEINKMIGQNILLGLKKDLWAYGSTVRKKTL